VKRLMLKLTLVGTILALLLVGTAGTVLAADPPDDKPFVCPSVNPNNGKGMWVIGMHGAYYVNVPTKGGQHEGELVYVNISEHVEHQAQIRAGYGLYHKLPSYPYFEGMTMVLHPDGKDFIWNEFGIDIGMAMMIYVVPSDTPSWDGETLYANVPLFSAVFW